MIALICQQVNIQKETEESVDQEELRLGELRHQLLAVMQVQARLNMHHRMICHPKSELGHVFGKRNFFSLNLPLKDSRQIRLPLPLPQVRTI